MVISKNIIGLMNYRIQQEELSSRLYLAMSVWLDFNGYSGAAKLWKTYSQEELKHANWAYQYLLDLNIKPAVPTLESPTGDYKGLPQIIALSLQHELDITAQCNELANQAGSEMDHMTMEFAHRYLKEQTEEIAKVQLWVDKLNIFGDDKIALRLLDQEMGG
jgi:ferritin